MSSTARRIPPSTVVAASQKGSYCEAIRSRDPRGLVAAIRISERSHAQASRSFRHGIHPRWYCRGRVGVFFLAIRQPPFY